MEATDATRTTRTDYIHLACINVALALKHLEKAVKDHALPNSYHATELAKVKSDFYDLKHKLERL